MSIFSSLHFHLLSRHLLSNNSMEWGYVVTCSLSCLSLSLAIPISVPPVVGSHLHLGFS